MYSPAKQGNTPLIAGNLKGKILFFLEDWGLVHWGLFLFWSVGEKTTVEEYYNYGKKK